MLFFRSEERVREWCAERGREPGGVMTLPQLWALSIPWFGNRLSPDWRRPTPVEIRAIFDSLGLTGSFWDPEAT